MRRKIDAPEHRLWFAKAVADSVCDDLLSAGIPRVEVVGEIRRGLNPVSAVDIVAYGDHLDHSDPLYKFCLKHFGLMLKTEYRKLLKTQTSGLIRDIPVYIHPAKEKNWITNVFYYTGPMTYVKFMISKAFHLDFKLTTEHGLFSSGCQDSPVMLITEEQLYGVLGMPYVLPKNRVLVR